MRVINASFYYDDFIETEEELLQKYLITVDGAEALQRKGVDMIVMQRFKRNNYLEKNKVKYYFIKDQFTGRLEPWQLPFKFLKRIISLKADIVHLHTFPCSIPVFLLRFLLNKKTGMVIQNHGGIIIKGLEWKLYAQMANIADAFFFTTTEQAKHWFKSKNLLKKVMPVMEGCTVNFNIPERNRALADSYKNEARLKLCLQGDPVFLWIARLDENKDPLTILNGLEAFFKIYSKASLYMIYSDATLLAAVQEKISRSESLHNKVYLLGKIPHNQIQNYYRSADYFVLGSHYESSGFVVIEALSCGCVPIVTDIPSFRMITDNGKLGALWKAGDKNTFVDAVHNAMQKPLKEEASKCIEFFSKNLSSDAIAATTVSHYKKIIAARNEER